MKKLVVLLTGLLVSWALGSIATATPMPIVENFGDSFYDASNGDIQIGPKEITFRNTNQKIGFHGFNISFKEDTDVSLKGILKTLDDLHFDLFKIETFNSKGGNLSSWSYAGQDAWWKFTEDSKKISMKFNMDANSTLSFGWNTRFDQLGASNFEGNMTFTPAPVPEPATMLLFGAGLVSLAGRQYRRKIKKSVQA